MVFKYLVPSVKALPYTNSSGEISHRHMGAAYAALHSNFRGHAYSGPNRDIAIDKLDELYAKEGLPTPEDGFHGEGLFDTVKEYFKPKAGYNNASTKTLSEYGNCKIDSIVLKRAPVKSMLTSIINFLSLGTFSSASKDAGYDKYYHLAMVVDVVKDSVHKKIVIEKNAVINISPGSAVEENSEFKTVSLVGDVSLSQLMSKTEGLMGSKMFPYNAFTNNCQVFIDSILKANGLLTPELHSWLFQSLDEVAKKIPYVTKAIVNAATTTGAIVDKITGGRMTEAENKAFSTMLMLMVSMRNEFPSSWMGNDIPIKDMYADLNNSLRDHPTARTVFAETFKTVVNRWVTSGYSKKPARVFILDMYNALSHAWEAENSDGDPVPHE